MSNLEYTISLNDNEVPEGYIGIYKLFSEDKYCLPTVDKERWCLGTKRLKAMRKQTFKEVKERYDLCKATNFSNFWNGNLEAINSIGINKFANILYFKELSDAMICFQNEVVNPITKSKTKVISWGIKDSIYRNYYKSQAKALKDGTEPEKVSLYDSNISRSGNLFKMEKEVFWFDEKNGTRRMVKVVKNALLNQFELWCKIKGLEKQQGMYQAMEYMMLHEPIDEIKEIGAYQRKCDLDYVEILIPQSERDTVGVRTEIPAKIHAEMKNIIKRYNSDPENAGADKMTIPAYIVQGIVLLNSKTSLKYSNPKKYAELQKIKKAKEYNEKLINKKKK